MSAHSSKLDYLLQLADNALIIGQRLGEWCGHGPVLEQDLAMTNISLDYIGRARLLYQYAGELTVPQRNEDEMAMLRNEWEYRNILLVEQPNGNFAKTVARQFYLEAFQFPYFQALQNSLDPVLAGIAEKSIKETAYHLKWSSEWVIRLGDGTEESHQKMQQAINDLWEYTGELFVPSIAEKEMLEINVSPNLAEIESGWNSRLDSVFHEATLKHPQGSRLQSGGKQGRHSEYMGYILSELQYMQRAYPGMEW